MKHELLKLLIREIMISEVDDGPYIRDAQSPEKVSPIGGLELQEPPPNPHLDDPDASLEDYWGPVPPTMPSNAVPGPVGDPFNVDHGVRW